jgi:uncharacterized protein (TIGR02145 family)
MFYKQNFNRPDLASKRPGWMDFYLTCVIVFHNFIRIYASGSNSKFYNMKRVALSIIILTMCIFSMAQVPESFNYQAIPRNGSGGTYPDQKMNIRISLLSDSPAGEAVYTEIFETRTTSLGIINLQIGKGTPESGSFTEINWGKGSYYLKVEIDPAAGKSYVEMGTSQLLSVPYALHSKTAENGFTGNYNDLSNKPVLFDGTWTGLTGKPATIASYGITDAVNTTGDQTIAGVKTFTGTINAGNKTIINVATPLSATDAATKAYVDVLLEKIERLESLTGVEEPVIDLDGNSYNTIRIGTQVWMTENLKTTRYNNGNPIPDITDNTAWGDLTTSGYCWYNNQEAANKATYGALYNWYTVSIGNLCPTGWHVPTDAEWTTLTTYLGGAGVAGGKLKEAGTMHWTSPNTGATDETHYTALPGGVRFSNGTFNYFGGLGQWWSVSEYDVNSAMSWDVTYINGSAHGGSCNKKFGTSVRCLRD